MGDANSDHALDQKTKDLAEALSSAKGEIAWADDASAIFEMIQDIYSIFARKSDFPDQVKELENKVRELEHYLLVDLERQIITRNCRSPYYMERISKQLMRAKEVLGRYRGIAQDIRNCDHVSADLQASFVEYGFCQSFEVLYEISEINRRLEAVSVKMNSIEASAGKIDAALTLADLHDVVAQQHGIQQAATAQNLDQVRSKYEGLTKRMTKLENNVCKDRLNKDSATFKKYKETQEFLKKPFTSFLFESDPTEIINFHMVHPGTRQWLLEKFQRWLYQTKKRMFFMVGQTGSGKTAMAASACKLYGADVIATHFFTHAEGTGTNNTVKGLIQSLALDLCKTVPEYAQYMHTRYNNKESELTTQLDGAWQLAYDALLKNPLNALYGAGSNASAHCRRKLIVIDGLDEANEAEWGHMKQFLTAITKDITAHICLFVTCRARFAGQILPTDEDRYEGVRLEDRAWQARHIKDIEIYMSSSIGAILSGEDEMAAPEHAKADEMTLQKTIDELLRMSSGRFDFAIELMESFAKEMSNSGQFLSSVKKATTPVRQAHKNFDSKMGDFASPFRAYRDKEGRSVAVRVMRQSTYPMDKTRVALIRGRHKIV